MHIVAWFQGVRMNIRLALAAGFALLAGCDGPSEFVEEGGAENADQAQVSWLYLRCTGTAKKLYGAFEETLLFAVPDTTQFGDVISEYNFDDKLFYGACSNRSYKCAETVSDEIIDARGGVDGEFPSSKMIKINRVTGNIAIYEYFNGTLSEHFEGTCEKTDEPQAQEAKF